MINAQCSEFQYSLRGLLTPADRGLICAINADGQHFYIGKSTSIRRNYSELKRASAMFPPTVPLQFATNCEQKDGKGIYLLDSNIEGGWQVRKLLIDLRDDVIAPVGVITDALSGCVELWTQTNVA